MTTSFESESPTLPAFTAESVRRGLAAHRAQRRRALIVAFSILATLLALFVVLSLLAGRSDPWSSRTPMMFVVIAVLVVATVTITLHLQWRRARRIARSLIRHDGSICLWCHAPLARERPRPPSDVHRQCCQETTELFTDEELRRWWAQWLTHANRRVKATAFAEEWNPLIARPRSSRRLRSIALGALPLMVLIPLLFAVFPVIFSRRPLSFEAVAIEALVSLPNYAGMLFLMVGINAIVVGVSWRFERGPFCAKCGYRWQPSAQTTCPECGSNWSTPAGRRLHRVRRHVAMIATGGALIVMFIAWTFGGYGLKQQATLVPTGMLLSNADFATIYCPRVEALANRSLDTVERRAMALGTIEALEAALKDPSRAVTTGANYTALRWLSAEISGVRGPVDAEVCARARSLMAPLSLSIVQESDAPGGSATLRLEGVGIHTPLSAGAGGSLRLAVERPSIEPIESSVVQGSDTALARGLVARPWGDPIDAPMAPVGFVRHGPTTEFAVAQQWLHLRIDIPIALPQAAGRYLIRVCHWVILDPAPGASAIVGPNGSVIVPQGGWAERYEHRMLFEVPQSR